MSSDCSIAHFIKVKYGLNLVEMTSHWQSHKSFNQLLYDVSNDVVHTWQSTATTADYQKLSSLFIITTLFVLLCIVVEPDFDQTFQQSAWDVNSCATIEDIIGQSMLQPWPVLLRCIVRHSACDIQQIFAACQPATAAQQLHNIISRSSCDLGQLYLLHLKHVRRLALRELLLLAKHWWLQMRCWSIR